MEAVLDFKERTLEEYENMTLSELLDLRHDFKTPTEEKLKVLKVLEKRFPLGVCYCRPFAR
jgi:hypothetical protein